MQDQKMLSVPIPWYRTRWFWGIIIGALLLWGLVMFYLFLSAGRSTPVQLYENLVLSFGAGYFGLLGSVFLGSVGNYILVILYFLGQAFFAMETFRKPHVNVLYPILFTVLFVSGNLFTYSFLAGLN